MKKTLTAAILCMLIQLNSTVKAYDESDYKSADFKIGLQSNPSIIVIKGLNEFAHSIKALMQEMQKIPSYITHTQRSMHIVGTMFIGCALCCAGIYGFIKNDKKELKDYIFNVGFIGIGAGLVLFSPSISRLMIPMTT